MNLKQYYLGCLAHASYLIADEETKIAAVVDPQRDIDQYIEDAEKNKWDIRYVLLTHFHADFLAGHLELRERTGAQICFRRQSHSRIPLPRAQKMVTPSILARFSCAFWKLPAIHQRGFPFWFMT